MSAAVRHDGAGAAPNLSSASAAEVLLMDDVQRLTGLSRSTLKVLVSRGDFPLPRQLSPRRIGFLRGDVQQWLSSRPVAACRRSHPDG